MARFSEFSGHSAATETVTAAARGGSNVHDTYRAAGDREQTELRYSRRLVPHDWRPNSAPSPPNLSLPPTKPKAEHTVGSFGQPSIMKRLSGGNGSVRMTGKMTTVHNVVVTFLAQLAVVETDPELGTLVRYSRVDETTHVDRDRRALEERIANSVQRLLLQKDGGNGTPGAPSRPRRSRLCRIAAFVLFYLTASGTAGLAADFSDTNFRGAHLTNADLRGSDLSGANLTGADLSGSDFRETNITQAQLDSACGDGTILPTGLRIQACSSRADRIGSRLPANLDQASLEIHGVASFNPHNSASGGVEPQ
jgi:hypothetical protein